MKNNVLDVLNGNKNKNYDFMSKIIVDLAMHSLDIEEIPT